MAEGGAETEVGIIPRPEDFDLAELDITRETMRELFSIKPDEWKTELEGQKHFFETLKPGMPEALLAEREKVGATVPRSNGSSVIPSRADGEGPPSRRETHQNRFRDPRSEHVRKSRFLV